MLIAIKDSTDLARVLDQEPAPTESRKRYIVDRARALGRIDLLPKSFLERSVKTQSDLLNELSERSGIDVYRLRCVFLRGLRECKATDLSGKDALDYANRRLELFVAATLENDEVRSKDADLIPR